MKDARIAVAEERPKLSLPDWIFLGLVLAFFAVFLLYPIGHVLVKAFLGKDGLTFSFFSIMFRRADMREMIANSLLIGLITTVGTSLISFPLAFIVARYAFPLKRHMTGLLMAPMIMPPFVGAIGVQQLLARGGSINLLLIRLHLIAAPIDFSSPAGRFWVVIALQVLHLYPIMYVNLVAALANVDPSLEEAGRVLGDRGSRLFRRITFPLMLPGYFAGAVIVFIWAFTDLGTPLILNYRKVIAVQIWHQSKSIHENPMAYALVVVVLGLTTLSFVAGRWLLGRHRYEMLSKGTMSAEERRPSAAALPFFYLAILLVVGLAVLPHAAVILTAVGEKWSGTVLPAKYTGEYFARIFRPGRPQFFAFTGTRNSLFLSLLSTTLDVILGVGIAYYLARKRVPWASLLDALAMLPLALPGIVLAFGYVGCFSGTPLDPARHNPMPLLVIAYAVRRLPYMVRAAYAGLQQTSRDLEDASLSLGASPMTTVARITVPLIAANLIAGAILSFSFAMLEVSDSLILAFREPHYPLTKAIYVLQGAVVDGQYVACAMGVFAMVLLCGTLLASAFLLGKRMGQLFRVG